MLLVLVIIATIIGISIPKFTKSHAHKLIQSESRKLESFFQYIQTKSRADRENYKVIIDSEDDEYWYEVKVEGETKISKRYKIPDKLELKNEGDEEIWFHPDMSSSGELSLDILFPKYNYRFSVNKEQGVSKIRMQEIK